jgi:two-component system, OmpR family, sensor kinase
LTVRRTSLALRISLLSVVIAVITALVAGGLAINLIRQTNTSAAQKTLAQVADAAAATADQGTIVNGTVRAARTLQALKITFATIGPAGKVSGQSALANQALSSTERTEVLAGDEIHSRRTVNGQSVLIEARPIRAGGIVLVQRRQDAIAVGDAAIRRLLLALLVAVAVAIGLGLLVSWRLTVSLRRTAAAEHALRSGRRDVVVEPDGPQEVAEVAEALNLLATGLAQSEGRQQDFLMSVSHDLRTPLTAIRGYAESLADGMVGPDDSQRVGAILVGEADRLGRLVGDLLDLARLDAQVFRIDPIDVDVAALAQAAAAVWVTRCAAEDIPFRLERRDAQVRAHTDPTRLRQILDGLLENALRVTPATAPIVLATRLEQSPDGRLWVVAEVRDGGPGLRDADLGVAFDRSVLYERYRGVRRVGTGLGLAIVHGLVGRLGGTVEAGHAPEGGARFTVWIPARTTPFISAR